MEKRTEIEQAIKEKLKAESERIKAVQQQNEKYTVTEPDLYYKEESFNSGETFEV